MQTEFAEMSLGKFDVIIWTSSPSSVIVKGWKAAMASFKKSQKWIMSLLDCPADKDAFSSGDPEKVACGEGKRAVCHMSDYLLQMRNDSVS